MNELLAKVSSYNLFNYLLPGVVFAILAEDVLGLPVPRHGIAVDALLCYFLGLVISRFGSLVVEPVLKSASIVCFSDYADFVAASRQDSHLAVLSEANNTYRTLCSLFALLLLLRIYAAVVRRVAFLRHWDPVILASLLLVMFVFSYRKQSSYIRRRVRVDIDKMPSSGGTM